MIHNGFISFIHCISFFLRMSTVPTQHRTQISPPHSRYNTQCVCVRTLLFSLLFQFLQHKLYTHYDLSFANSIVRVKCDKQIEFHSLSRFKTVYLFKSYRLVCMCKLYIHEIERRRSIVSKFHELESNVLDWNF